MEPPLLEITSLVSIHTYACSHDITPFDNIGYKSGWPACCHQPGGDIMNCPKDKPSCETDSETVVDTVATKFVKSVISSQ